MNAYPTAHRGLVPVDLRSSVLILPSTINMLPLLLLVLLVFGVTTGQNFQCPSRTGFYPHTEQCDVYYKCSKGIGEEKFCPEGLVFKDGDPNSERCDIPDNVDCGDRIILQEAQPSKGCPHANGVFRHPDPGVCNKFYQCTENRFHEMSCPPGLIFDDLDGNICAWPATARRQDCGKSKKESIDGFSCPDEKVMGVNGRPTPHPTYPHPTDCTKFYICRDGSDPTLGSCSGGTVYNDVTFQCDSPENVPGCENPARN